MAWRHGGGAAQQRSTGTTGALVGWCAATVAADAVELVTLLVTPSLEGSGALAREATTGGGWRRHAICAFSARLDRVIDVFGAGGGSPASSRSRRAKPPARGRRADALVVILALISVIDGCSLRQDAVIITAVDDYVLSLASPAVPHESREKL